MERFRLVRFVSGDSASDFEYLQSLAADGTFRFSSDPSAALLMTWDDYAAAAFALWRLFGPADIFYDRVFVLPSGGVI